MGRKIVLKECISTGKYQGKNDDDIYVGENFAAVIDGVSYRSTLMLENEKIGIAQIIKKAIKKIDSPTAPRYAKELSFNEFIQYINWYIGRYLEEKGLENAIGQLEATGIFYSKYHNQIWLVGDCRAIVDGKVYKNPLKIDDVYIDIRIQIVKALLAEGYSKEELENNDISRTIIANPELLPLYIKNPERQQTIKEYRNKKIKSVLLECGFPEDEIEEQGLVYKYYNPRNLQQDLKNNPFMGDYGYAIFNGIYTEKRNCKMVQLPQNVKTIKLFSDGFSVDALNNDKDIGYAVRKIMGKAKNDPLSIAENPATHPAKRYSSIRPEKAIDDASAIVLEIKQQENELDERG